MKTIKAKLVALIAVAVLAVSLLSGAAFYGLFWCDYAFLVVLSGPLGPDTGNYHFKVFSASSFYCFYLFTRGYNSGKPGCFS